MKNLKKLLALVLVAVMVLSFGAISASAAFTDTAASTYQEAISVLSGIGVIDGTTSTTFEPTGTLTREAAAKVIVYMLLGPTNAALIKNATSQRFSDVAPDRWSAGYIEYCASQNIVGGVGDGSFNPAGKLTTAAFTKMLLCALGYKADVEGLTGPSWANNTAALAVTAKVFDPGIAISGTIDCTREQAAQLALKALKADTVQYSGGTVITIGESTITTGAVRSKVTYTIGTADVVKYNSVDDGVVQFCEQHFPLLSTSASTVGGRTGIIWKNGAKVISGFVGDPNALVTSTNGTLYNSLTSPTKVGYIGYMADTANPVAFKYNDNAAVLEASTTTTAARASGTYVLVGSDLANGTAGTLYKLTADVASGAVIDGGNSTTIAWDGKVGVTVNFLDTDYNGKFNAVNVVQKQFGVLSGPVTTQTIGTLTYVTIPGTSVSGTLSTFVSYPSDLAPGDVALFYTSGNGITYVTKAKTVTGIMTGYTDSTVDKVIVGGTSYTLSDVAMLGGSALNGTVSTVATAAAGVSDVIYYLDDNGSICSYYSPKASTAVDKLLFVRDSVATAVMSTITTTAEAVFHDGTTSVITVKKVAALGSAPAYITATTDADLAASAMTTGVTGKLCNNTYYTYTKNEDGSYNLTSAALYDATKHLTVVDTDTANEYADIATPSVAIDDTYLKITNGAANFLSTYTATAANAWGAAAYSNILATSDTVFVLRSGPIYTTYKGIANMPTTYVFAANATVDVMTNLYGYASMVVISAGNAPLGISSADIVFAYGGASYVYDPVTPYYTTAAVVNGEIVPAYAMSASNTITAGAVSSVTSKTSKGVVDSVATSGGLINAADAAQTKITLSGSTLATYNGATLTNSYVLNSNVKCYVYNSTYGTLNQVDASALTTQYTAGTYTVQTVMTSATNPAIAYVFVTVTA